MMVRDSLLARVYYGGSTKACWMILLCDVMMIDEFDADQEKYASTQ